ncbi:MAG TPA: hypothetical protein VGL53_10215 [Bryobacteraceae bacterium]|jgi:hypothetical protein
MMMKRAAGQLFKSFWQAGFECSTHVLRNGRRLDLVASTGHDVWASQDFTALAEMGMFTAREGLRWHLIEQEPRQYDFSSARTILNAAEQHGIELIWDLLHFGWPDFLNIFDPSWVDAFGAFAEAFSLFLRQESHGRVWIAPVNEISFLAWAGGDTSYLNPFGTGKGAELKRQLVRGATRASQAVLKHLPEARLVFPEPVIHIVGDPKRPDDLVDAERYRSSMFEAWDMVSGRAQPELGGHERYLDVIGVNYYDRNQWWNFGTTIFRDEPEYRPFREILAEVYERYKRPIFVSETGTENEDRPAWLAYIAQEARAALRAGVDLQGICLYPILNHPGWDDDRHCRNGLWDYPSPSGEREIYRPLAEELARQKDLENELRETSSSNQSSPSNRSDLSLSPPLEFRFSTAPAFDEQIRQRTPRFLLGGTSYRWH